MPTPAFRAVGAGGQLRRPPLTGAVAARVAAVDPSLVLVYEGGGQWALCEHLRAARQTGCVLDLGDGPGRISVVEDGFSLIKRYSRLDGGEIEADVRRMVWYRENGGLLDEIDRHNEAVEEGNLRDCSREIEGRGEYYLDRFTRTRHYLMPGRGVGIGGAARTVYGGRSS